LARQAFSEDPYDRGAIPGIGLYFYLAGRYGDAIQFLEAQIGENDMQGARHNLGDALAEAAAHASPGDRVQFFDRAMAQAARVTAIERKLPGGATPMGDEMYAHYFTLIGDYQRADFYFSRMLAEMDRGLESPAIVAWIYALRGEKSKALDSLERAFETRDRALFYLKLFPALASIRGEDRFRAILARMKL
jgi:tetratricopeptide (TPR) repeat protein